jgi:hypothetical protein
MLCILWGCFPIKHPQTPPPAVVAPSIETIRSANDSVRAIRGVVRTELMSQGKSLKVKQAIAVAQPGWMRFETLGFLDQPLWILATDGVVLQAISLPENRFYQGSVSDGLTHLLGFRLTGHEFVSLFLGEIPDRMDGFVRYDPQKGLHRLTFPPSSRWAAETFWIDPKTLRAVEISKIDASTGHEIRMCFNRFRRKESVMFPGEVAIELPGPESRVRFVFRKTEINPPLPPDLFRLTIPPGVEIVEIDDMHRFPFAFWAEELTEP